MAKFGAKIPEDEPTPAVERVVTQQTVQQTVQSATVVQPNSAAAQVIIAEAHAEQDQQILEKQLDKQEEHWMKSYWRPAMGWLYMAICFMDFIAFPIIAMIMPVVYKGFGVSVSYSAWQSLTLSNGGLIHLAFGAILGITSYTRGQEKISSPK